MAKILLATSEAIPFAKTGGLADVAGTLPVELDRLGHDVTVIMPAYRCIHEAGSDIQNTNIYFDIPIGNQVIQGSFLKAVLPGSNVTIYFVKQNDFFDRVQLYGEDGQDYRDNCQRFVFFCRSVLESIRLLDLKIELLHCNDWQTGLVPLYLDAEYRHSSGYNSIGTLMTIHNLAYQGRFWHWDMLLTGLDWKFFNWHQLEYYGDLSLLKGGIASADAINTVSPTYAQEIQTAELGCGLEGTLRCRSETLSGILNGVNYDVWNPRTDEHIAENYDENSWPQGKATCKANLQKELGLSTNSNALLFGFVGRLVEQKGLSLILEVMKRWVHRLPAQWAILGSGNKNIESELQQLAHAYPNRVSVNLAFSEPLAHRIEAGADAFLMPSRFEPCGLNQMYSLKYGTVPIVHNTGGLSDTIVHANTSSLASKTANGFSFEAFDSDSLERTLNETLELYENQPTNWHQLVATGMKQDWSWKKSAQAYGQLYQQIITHVRQSICA